MKDVFFRTLRVWPMIKVLRSILYFKKRTGWVGVVRSVQAKLLGSQTLTKVKPAGIREPFWLRLRSSDIPTYDQVFLQNEYDFRAADPKFIVDAGANIGLVSILFANRYPLAKIVAIEPDSSNFELLRRNVAPYDNVIAVHAALWHENTKIHIHDPGFGEWGYMTLEDGEGDVVETVTIDGIVQQFGIDRIDILKVDIEGAEKEVFSDPGAWIDKVDGLIIELHDRIKQNCSSTFYGNIPKFDLEWTRGENVYMSQRGTMTPVN